MYSLLTNSFKVKSNCTCQRNKIQALLSYPTCVWKYATASSKEFQDAITMDIYCGEGKGRFALPPQKSCNEWKIHNCSHYMHCGTSCHKIVTKWLKQKKIKVIAWPGISLDLNPIENVWDDHTFPKLVLSSAFNNPASNFSFDHVVISYNNSTTPFTLPFPISSCDSSCLAVDSFYQCYMTSDVRHYLFQLTQLTGSYKKYANLILQLARTVIWNSCLMSNGTLMIKIHPSKTRLNCHYFQSCEQ